MALFRFSEDTKENITRSIAILHNIVHWTWVPAVLLIGYTQTNPRPSFIKLISPIP